MIDRYERAVFAVLASAAAVCAAGALSMRPASLPAADAARWVAIAHRARGEGHIFRRTWQIDAIDAGARHLSDTADVPPLRRGAVLAVTGWAVDPDVPGIAGGVAYRIDRGPWRPARYHLARPDVAVALGLPGANDAGYTLAVQTGALAPGPHELELATTGARGTRLMRPAVRFSIASP